MIVQSANPFRSPLPAERLEASSIRTYQAVNLSYRDDSGNAFRLSMERETIQHTLTYDRQALLSGRPGRGADHRHALPKELREELEDWQDAFREMEGTVGQFKKLLHRFLKANHPGYAHRYRAADPVEDAVRLVERRHLEVTAVSQTVSLRIDRVDPEYWSADRTAVRLRDFAVALHRDGDREGHLRAMVDAMERGYREAEQAYGGGLPEIARETLDRAVGLLEEWAADGSETSEPSGLDLVA